MSACRSCGASITWVTAAKSGKSLPLDAVSSPTGNLVIVAGAVGKVRAADILDGPEVPRFTSHFATCPNANEWRKPR
jgi:hypothetical protein